MTPLEWIHAVRDVPSEGLPVERPVTEEEARRLAEALEIVSVDKLVARYKLVPRPGGRLALTGTINAKVTQACVVTLEPVSSALSLPLDVVFTSKAPDGDLAAGEGSLDDLDTPDEEPIENGTVDVGRIVLEELMSGIDPYPRSPDANFDWAEDTNASRADHPFAALARLRKPEAPDDQT